MMLSTLLQCCIVIAMQIKLTVVVVVVVVSLILDLKWYTYDDRIDDNREVHAKWHRTSS